MGKKEEETKVNVSVSFHLPGNIYEQMVKYVDKSGLKIKGFVRNLIIDFFRRKKEKKL